MSRTKMGLVELPEDWSHLMHQLRSSSFVPPNSSNSADSTTDLPVVEIEPDISVAANAVPKPAPENEKSALNKPGRGLID